MADKISPKFAHLHTHSHYSLLEAVPKIPDIISSAKADNQHAIALTDLGNMYGTIEFYKECTKAGIKPIIGVDFFVAPRTRHDMDQHTDGHTYRLVLLAKNNIGYNNLIKLVSASYLEGFFQRPRVDRELMSQHREGLIAILPSIHGEHVLAIDSTERMQEILRFYSSTFGDDLYMEIMRNNDLLDNNNIMTRLLGIARKSDIKPVATHEIYYLKKDDAIAKAIVEKIRDGGRINSDMGLAPENFSFFDTETMVQDFADAPDAIENTVKIADECDVSLTLGKGIFPTFPIPAGKTDDSMLADLTEQGIVIRKMADTPELRQRMQYELGIIKQKGYASYFLIVADLLSYARSVGILTNTRGSAAGSLVSYLCGITTVDPIRFQMPFERFLNPERPSAPDIDMDIADNKRDQLIEYARRKYGVERVVQIGTFGTMMARAAVRDVNRALGHGYGTGDAIAKLIPFGKQGFPVTIDGALESTPDLADAYKKDPIVREVLDLSRRIEGNARHVGVHAAGVILAPTPATDYTPIQLDPKGGKIITQYDMYSIVDEYGGVGLLKFDFLGLTNLSVLADARDRVLERLNIKLDLDNIPQEDTNVFAMLTRGETLGVFQMASQGMTSYLMELRPTSVEDLNAMVALYRPGPMAFIPDYIDRKRNPAKIKYIDSRLEKILRQTYGILIYQDDVMLIAVQLAGYGWGEADKFRKAMGKKIPEEMKAQHSKFVDGCIKHGMKPDVAAELWEQIETFAAYGFNKAHAASYGNLSYKTAYMKANYPVDYMSALATADAGDVEKIGEVVAECKRIGLSVLGPSINESNGTFTVIDDKTIRFGLYSIKNFGEGVSDSVVSARQKGKFKNLADFLTRVTDKNLNKKSLEALIMCGALDEFGERGAMMASVEDLLEFHKDSAQSAGQVSLFGTTNQDTNIALKQAPAMPIEQKLKFEKDLLGLYVSGHPLDKFKDILSKQKMPIAISKEKFPRGATTVIAGFLENTKTITTKRGDPMMFAQLSDFSGNIEIVIFPDTLKEFQKIMVAGTCIAVKGKFNDRNGTASFMVEKAKTL